MVLLRRSFQLLVLIEQVSCEAKVQRPKSKNKDRSTPIKGRNGQPMAVSPFDGITRIRFKGSPDCRLLMLLADSHPHSHSEIRIQTGLSASRLPRKLCTPSLLHPGQSHHARG